MPQKLSVASDQLGSKSDAMAWQEVGAQMSWFKTEVTYPTDFRWNVLQGKNDNQPMLVRKNESAKVLKAHGATARELAWASCVALSPPCSNTTVLVICATAAQPGRASALPDSGPGGTLQEPTIKFGGSLYSFTITCRGTE